MRDMLAAGRGKGARGARAGRGARGLSTGRAVWALGARAGYGLCTRCTRVLDRNSNLGFYCSQNSVHKNIFL